MDIPSKNKPAAGRYALLDELRGLDLLSMIGYHACWDLIFLFGMSAAWYTGWQGHLWQQSICWVFILLSGRIIALINLENLFVSFYIISADRERNHHFDAVVYW